jgi:hypothetical protein
VGWQEPIDCGGVAVFPNIHRGRPGWRGADSAPCSMTWSQLASNRSGSDLDHEPGRRRRPAAGLYRPTRRTWNATAVRTGEEG